MISRASDYLFVSGDNIDDDHPHGDLDRIIINGEVMPLRTGNTDNVDSDGNPIPKQNILRGEDIAFLLEAVLERDAARYQYLPYKRRTFYRYLDYGSLDYIQTMMVNLATDGTFGRGSHFWLRPDHQSFGTIFNCGRDDHPFDLYPSYFIDSTDVHSPDVIASGTPLRKQRILNCFEDIEKFSALTIGVVIETPITSSDYVVDGTFEEGPEPYGFCGLNQYVSTPQNPDYRKTRADYSYKVNDNKSLVIRSNTFLYAKNVKLYGLFRLTDSNNVDGQTKFYYGFIPITTVQEIHADTISITAGTINASMQRMLQNAQNDKGDEPSRLSWLTWFQMNDAGTPQYSDVGVFWSRSINLGLEAMFALVELNERTRLPN